MRTVFCNRVSKQIGGTNILTDVSFEVREGDTFGFLGPNGAGKTTTIRILLGLYRRTLGDLSILEMDTPGSPALLRQIGFVLDADGLYDNLSAIDNLAYYGELYGISDSAHRCAEVLKQAGLAGRAREKVKVFSTGMRQRLALARAILHRPRLLILDEPTSGVDPGGQAEVRELILALARQGTTVFFSSHNLDEVQRICNRVAFISNGAVKLTGETAQLMQNPQQRVTLHLAEPVPGDARRLLERLGAPAGNGAALTQVELVLDKGVATNEVVSQLVSAGARIDGVQHVERSLAQLYADVIQEEL